MYKRQLQIFKCEFLILHRELRINLYGLFFIYSQFKFILQMSNHR